jgi:hypothetical protein
MATDTKEPVKPETQKLSDEDKTKARKKGGLFGDPILEIE